MNKKLHKKIFASVLCASLLMATPATAAQPDITWLQPPDKNITITNFAPDCYGDGLYAVITEQGERIYTVSSPNGAGTFLTGYVNQQGEWMIPPVYFNGTAFSNGYATVTKETATPLNGGNYYEFVDYFIDRQGNIVNTINKPATDNVASGASASEGIVVIQQNGKWGCTDENGAVILPCKYEEVRPCSDNRIAVKWQGRYGYFDKNGEKIIDFLYGAATDFHDGLAVVSTGDFSNCTWEDYWFVGAGLTKSYNNNQFGVIDRWGNVVLPEEYSCISDFADGTAICQHSSDNKVGIIQAPEVAVQDPGTRSFVRLYLNNELLNTDQSPVIKNGRTLVPIRTVTEALEADVTWDSHSNTVIVKTAADILLLPIDSTVASFNDASIILDVPATIINGRTMVPLRFISELLQANVQWDGINKIVHIRY